MENVVYPQFVPTLRLVPLGRMVELPGFGKIGTVTSVDTAAGSLRMQPQASAPPGQAITGQAAAGQAPGGVDDTVADYLTWLHVERGASANTTAAYRRDLTRYAVFLRDAGRAVIGDVTQHDVENFVLWLRTGGQGAAQAQTQAQAVAGQVTGGGGQLPGAAPRRGLHAQATAQPARPLSAASTARHLSAVRSLHAFALAEGLLASNVAAEVTPPATGHRLPHALTIDDVTALIEAAGSPDSAEPGQLRDRALLELLYSTGGRISEIVGLDVDALGWLGAQAQHIPEVSFVRLLGKGNKERVVPVGSYARQALDSYLIRARPALAAHGAGSPRLFLNALGRPLSRTSAYNILTQIADRAGIAGVSPHALRHSFATHLLSGGADIRVVQELLGHASVQTTQIYTLVTRDALREVYAQAHPRAR